MIKIRAGFLALSALGLLAVAPSNVDAAQKIIPGASCDNYNAGEANDIDRLVFGIRTTNPTASRNVTCGLARELTVAGGTVVVNGQVFAPNSMPITVYAYNNLGTTQFSSKSTTGTGNFSTPINFSAAELPAAAQLTVLVTLPANSGGYYTSTSLDH